LQHRLGDRNAAEEAMQESFARFAAAGAAAAPDKQRPYLFQIAANLLHDRARERLKQGGEVLSFDDPGAGADDFPADASACPQTAAEHRQRLGRLSVALEELPERQREAFVLHRFDGLTQEEVAQRMGISRRMVSKHLSRAFAYCELRVQFTSAEQMQQSIPDMAHRDTGEQP